MSAVDAGAPIPEPGSSLQKMQTTPAGPSLLAAELERLSAIWMVMSEQQTPGVCADIALFAMQNRAAIISALRVAVEARLAGWIISDDGAIFRPAHGADLMAALGDADKIVGEQRQRVEELEREGERVVEAGADRNRIGLNADGSLDEVVFTGLAHLEQMDDGTWWLGLSRPDGSGYHVWLHAKKRGLLVATHHEEPSARKGVVGDE